MQTPPDDNQKLRIESLEFYAGSQGSEKPLQISVGNITVLVGPNNSGKSLVLEEIEARVKRSNTDYEKFVNAHRLVPQIDLTV